MLDLESQVRRYAEHLDARVPDVTVEEVLGGRVPVVRPTARVPHRVTLVVAAAAVVLVLFGGVALLFQLVGDGVAPVVTEPETTVTEPPPPPDEPIVDPADRQAAVEFLASLGDVTTVETSLGTWSWRRIDPIHEMVGPPEAPRPATPEIDVAGVALWYPYWEHDGSATLGEVRVSVLSVGVGVDWGQVYEYEPGWVEGIWLEAPRLLEIVAFQHVDVQAEDRPDRPMDVLATLEASVMSGDPDAVEFRDVATGEVVFRMEATDPALPAEVLLQAAPSCSLGCPLVLRTLYVEGGVDGAAWVDPPWLGLPVMDAAVAVGADGFVLVAVVGSPEAPTLRLWGSPDGVNWIEVEPVTPAVVPRAELSRLRLAGDGERLVLVVESEAGPMVWDGDQSSVWTSTDGVAWTRGAADLDDSDVHAVLRTSFGWMLPTVAWQPDAGFDCVIWVSADALSWERIPLFPGAVPRGLDSTCYGDVSGGAGEEWWEGDTALATAFDLLDGLAWWRGGFEE